MSLELQFSALSVGASVDQQTGTLSVFDVIEEVRTPQLPVHLQSIVIALVWKNGLDTEFDGKMVIDLVTPDGAQQMVGQGDLIVRSDQKRVKAVLRFGGFPLLHFGQHRFVVTWYDGTQTKRGEETLPFEVVQITQVAQGAPPAKKPPVTH